MRIVNNVTATNETVGTSAASLVSARVARTQLVIYNNGSVAIYIGGDDNVDTDSGLVINTGSALSLDQFSGAIYAISGTASQDVRVLETY